MTAELSPEELLALAARVLDVDHGLIFSDGYESRFMMFEEGYGNHCKCIFHENRKIHSGRR